MEQKQANANHSLMNGQHARVARQTDYPSKDALAECFASMFVRQVRQCFSAVWADGFPRCRHRFPVM